MSAIGTSYAAGVAQTAHASQEVARRQDKTRTDRARDEADFSKMMVERLAAPEDAEDPDAELPDRQAPGYEQLYELPEAPEVPEAPTEAHGDAPHHDATGTPLADFHHIDVKA